MAFTRSGFGIYRGHPIWGHRVGSGRTERWADAMVEGLNYLEREGALDLLHDNAVRDDSNCDYRSGRLAAAAS